MTLTAGTRLGPYEVLSPLGAGGMGEVYMARDTRLDRTVAIKVLPAQFAADPESRARFDREARTISQLNHPHICVLHDVGHHDGLDFLVMEHLDGETLQARLLRGPLACDDALRIAMQIASALDRAHRAGIVHRDLKPGNIMLTKSGGARTGSAQAKLLDFGLAKAGAMAVTGGTATTLSATPPNLTARGTILGTFQYMAPEQLEGQPADTRSDIFAFGVVLYEMITGRKAFEGKSQASLIGAILKDQPAPISTVVTVAPAALDHVVSRCLGKDPDARWQSAADLVAELQWIAAGDLPAASNRGRAGLGRGERLAWLAAVIVATVLGGSMLWRSVHSTPAPAPVTARAFLPLPDRQVPAGGVTSLSGYPALAISPDGRSLVYSAADPNSTPSLFIRALNEENPHSIPGTEGAVSPFFSPDGRKVGFQSRNLLRTVTLGGGAPTTVFEGGVDLRGADWGDDGWIYFAPLAGAGLSRVREEGGTPEVLTTLAPGEKTHRWPCVLPGGKAVLFVVGTSRNLSFDDARIDVLALDTHERRPLVTGGTYPRYLPSGHLVYSRAGAIVAVPFDLQTLTRRGPDVTVQSGVQSEPTFGFANFATAGNGTLVYVPGTGSPQGRTLLFADRKGNLTPTGAPSDPYMEARTSSDGARLVVGIDGATSQIAIVDLARQGATTRLTSEWDNLGAVWTPDHTRIAFSSNREGGAINLYSQAVDSGGDATRLTTSAHSQLPLAWLADGKTLAFLDLDPAVVAATVWVVNVDDRKPRPSIKTPFKADPPVLSPDGLWLAYSSTDSTQEQVYVQAFRGGGRVWPISIRGGNSPVWNRNGWSANGGELFYRTAEQDVMAVPIAISPEFHPGTPTRLFNTNDRLVDVMPDGRFLIIKDDPRPVVTHFNLVVNWFAELASRAPSTAR